GGKAEKLAPHVAQPGLRQRCRFASAIGQSPQRTRSVRPMLFAEGRRREMERLAETSLRGEGGPGHDRCTARHTVMIRSLCAGVLVGICTNGLLLAREVVVFL